MDEVRGGFVSHTVDSPPQTSSSLRWDTTQHHYWITSEQMQQGEVLLRDLPRLHSTNIYKAKKVAGFLLWIEGEKHYSHTAMRDEKCF